MVFGDEPARERGDGVIRFGGRRAVALRDARIDGIGSTESRKNVHERTNETRRDATLRADTA